MAIENAKGIHHDKVLALLDPLLLLPPSHAPLVRLTSWYGLVRLALHPVVWTCGTSNSRNISNTIGQTEERFYA